MNDRPDESEALGELAEIARAAETLAGDERAFREAAEGYRANDAARFGAALEAVSLEDDCERICYFLCEKRCTSVCYRLCPEAPVEPDVEEMRAFAGALANVVRDTPSAIRLMEIIDSEDADAWQGELKRLGLERYCHQLCRFFCSEWCRKSCRELCLRPVITRVSSIPTSQFGPQGFGNGPSIPPFQVPLPDPPSGVGDHPIGGSSWLMGQFNMPTAVEYKVEVATSPGGPYTPISEPVPGYNGFPPPWPWPTRTPSGGPDPGWYAVADLFDSDGGPTPVGEKTLLFWSTPPDGPYYLRLRVRDGATERASGPLRVEVDNSAPPTPVIHLERISQDGTTKPIECLERVSRDQGDLILVTVQAWDQNFSRLYVNAEGNTSISVPLKGVPLPVWPGGVPVPLAKTYNGNVADTGYPAPTQFVWDPWSEPQILEHPCCYIVHVYIYDRAVVNNSWSGGHSNAGWEAIEIAL